ncbi:cytochrome P450 [Novosphingobium sp. JCM 18896]|uniref:cytochrome P450 n=1 Tax=Novosphingobium sp. JCM 18896 TaxID=2989731 RepID=UPI002221A216|nr:cytochrome P450 [Novosphingobium sp. JCM 18896]MCW1428700.1 cytochrome P450 [Novosphingobium sp. JCM 18896]
MPMGAELDLPYLTMEEDAFAADPFPHFARARAQHPWLARWQLGYVVTDYKAMRDLFAREDRMRMMYDDIVAIMEAEDTPWGDFQQRHMLSMAGATHKRVRDVLAPAFTPRQANAHRPLMREVISDLLDEWAPKRAFDFEEFASYFPITVMCRLIGASPDVIPGLRSAMEAIGLSTSMDKRWLPAMQEGVVTMERFVDGLIAERRAESREGMEPDLLDVLLRSQGGEAKEGRLTDRELADLLIFLFVAGYDTSKNMLTLTLRLLLDRPEVYQRCAEDHAFARQVIEESFRYGSTTSNQRVLNEEVEYRDVVLEKDAIVWFPLSIAAHDPRYAEAADRFDHEREQKSPHIGFGLGAHICLGQYIARAQIHEGLHLIAQRLLNPRSPGPEGFRPFPGTWGLRGLPIQFDLPGD